MIYIWIVSLLHLGHSDIDFQISFILLTFIIEFVSQNQINHKILINQNANRHLIYLLIEIWNSRSLIIFILMDYLQKKVAKQNCGQNSKPCSTISSRKSVGNYQTIDSKVSCASKSSTAPASTSPKSSSSLTSIRLRSIDSKNKSNILPKEDEEKINFALDCLLLVLMVMVFWGRICAIFCTTTWLFILLRRKGTRYSPEKCPTQNEVIMKG